MIRHFLQLSLITLLSGCALYGVNQIGDLYGESKPKNRLATNESDRDVYLNKVKPVLDNRCVVCHACYDASCQLKLSSPAGIDRGASKNLVYNASILTREPSRLFVDADTTEEWRERDFYPVLNERAPIAEANIEASVLYKMITLKNHNPMNTWDNDTFPEDELNFDLDHERQCPTIETFHKYAKDFPYSGMPYALPALNGKENTILSEWLISGAKMADAPQPASHQKAIDAWETFFNGDSFKQQLASRYIFEHLFLAHIHFDQLPGDAYYKIVRSSTPPGEPVSQIKTRLPFHDPGVARVYYRLWHDPETIVVKNHLPYAFNPERMAWMKKLFIDAPYEITELPGYEQDVASNPFRAFAKIPVHSRYRFMLEESRFTIMGFIKGPVCRGQVALNSIQDHFWVMFVDPDNQTLPDLDKFLMEQSFNLKLPGSEGGYSSLLGSWDAYSEKSDAFLKAKFNLLEKHLPGKSITMDYIWDGDGHNKNAALTVFRHFDSATVVNGLVGQAPKTAWLINYPLFERIHYLLVAEYDVFGNLAHQLGTRLYMDFLRQEGEISFLNLLPQEHREKIQKFWYRETDDALKEHLERCESIFKITKGIDIRADKPQLEFYRMLQSHLEPVLETKYDVLGSEVPPQHRKLLAELEDLSGYFLNFFPEVSILTIEDPDGKTYIYTVLLNLEHANVNSLFSEEDTRLTNEDYLTVVRGVVGDYPKIFWHVELADLDDFISGINKIQSEADYANVIDYFGIRRSHPDFWKHSDKIHSMFSKMEPIDGGLLDYNRLENR